MEVDALWHPVTLKLGDECPNIAHFSRKEKIRAFFFGSAIIQHFSQCIL